MENIPSFYNWLIGRYGQVDSQEGDLAKAVAMDERFPKEEMDCQPLIAYLIRREASRPVIEIFKDCWCEYMGTVDRIRYKDE